MEVLYPITIRILSIMQWVKTKFLELPKKLEKKVEKKVEKVEKKLDKAEKKIEKADKKVEKVYSHSFFLFSLLSFFW